MPAKLARYEILGTLGRGGFGVVYVAHDPELGRKVAIKVLDCDSRSGADRQARARLHREARALARFSHPNVVSVYDVGTQALDDGSQMLFVVMALVEGSTLSQWLRQRPRTCSEVLSILLRAGRGLAAAHDQGLVHRDFKPANVMVPPTGDAIVVDFGLARLITGDALVGEPAIASDRTSTDGLDETVTAPGSVPGTPSYMAPEQHTGAPGDARSDQYAFCVALYEALYGRRPFQGSDAPALRRAKEREAVAPPPAKTAVPRRVHQAVIRGLRADPEARWPSMRQLLEQLADPSRRRRRLALGLGGALVVAATILALAPSTDACPRPSETLDELWSARTQARLEEAFLATELPHAAATWERAHARLDTYARQWVASSFDACMSGQRHDHERDVVRARAECLQRRGGQLEALLRSFEEVDREIVNRAVEAVSALPPVDPCTEPDGLGTVPSPPPGRQAKHVLAARQKLATVAVLQELGKYEDGFEIALEVVDLARLAGHPPALAEAHLRLGTLALFAGRFELAVDELTEAARLGVEHGLDELVAVATITLVDVVGDRLLRFDDGRRWGRHARATIDRLGRPPILHADLTAALGNTAYRQGHHREALALHEECLEIRLATLGRDHPRTGLAYNNVANALLELGHIDRAIDAYHEGLTILEQVHGPEHPIVAWGTNNLGGAAARRGDLELSRRYYDRTLRIREASLPADHPDVIGVLVNLGALEWQARDLERARDLLQRALDLQDGRRADPLAFAGAMENLALVLLDLDDQEEAIRLLQRALLIRRDQLGAHETTAITVLNVGHAEFRRGDFEKARGHFVEAIHVLETSGSDGRIMSYALQYLGDSLVELGRFDDALAPLERALAMTDRLAEDPKLRARTQWALARALRADGGDRERATELARAALEDTKGDDDASLRQRIERWLDTDGQVQ